MASTTERLLTFEEYLAYDDGTDQRYELVGGRLEPTNLSTVRHFLIAKFLESVLEAEARRLGLPWVCLREAGVRTGRNRSRLSDLCVVTIEQARELLDQSAVFQTPPLLAIEVVSPDSIKRDYRYKRTEYAALDIPEYWIVDPLEAKVSVLLLEEGLYEDSVFIGEQKLISQTFPDLTITVEQVLAAGEIA
ncbi:Uma2 family endonuclease [Leptolyngbya sp. FACHB-261]|uniref:Uma2 family endonuclease n=1 Tax=Leptolyngbya sp. FACHB-261 TaxID=2692806 RepID=UPI001684FF77|nr:Uma2 family endonuclease [Leptolyngbya sp. FACHB-261]MBD2101498.1 Uma2 family endonuclease [Leptolyngbya sp. FACHB-261]